MNSLQLRLFSFKNRINYRVLFVWGVVSMTGFILYSTVEPVPNTVIEERIDIRKASKIQTSTVSPNLDKNSEKTDEIIPTENTIVSLTKEEKEGILPTQAPLTSGVIINKSNNATSNTKATSEGKMYKIDKSFVYCDDPTLSDEAVRELISSIVKEAIPSVEITSGTSKLFYYKNDRELLAHLVSSEDGQGSQEAKIAIVNVVQNRMVRYGKTMSEVVYEKSQFDGIKTKWFFTPPSTSTYEAVDLGLSGKRVLPEDALLFCDVEFIIAQNGKNGYSGVPDWANDKMKIRKIGSHTFYRDDNKSFRKSEYAK